MKKLLVGILILFGCCFSAYYIQSQGKDLSLKVLQPCTLNVAGDSCVEEYEIINTTSEDLDGNATLHIDYKGVCGEFPFDGEGIKVKYNNVEPNTKWINGDIMFTGFTIPKGSSNSELLLATNIALCPGTYDYTLVLSGTADIEYSSGGSGSFHFTPPPKQRGSSIVDGDIIRAPGDEGLLKYDVYIIKIVDNKQFKRLILNPHVFESYEHLEWDNIQLVDMNIMNSYTISSLVRIRDYDKGVFKNEVYKLFPNGDVGIKRHLNISQTEFEERGYDADSIYNINCIDSDAYITGEDIL